jgi:hypothetical protein
LDKEVLAIKQGTDSLYKEILAIEQSSPCYWIRKDFKGGSKGKRKEDLFVAVRCRKIVI